MKIALVSYSINLKTGAGRIIDNQSRYLRDSGHEVTLLCHKKKTFKGLTSIKIKQTPFWFIHDQKRRQRFETWCRQMCAQSGFDVVISHGRPHVGDVCFVHNLPERVCLFLNKPYNPYHKNETCKKIVANSIMVKEDLVNYYGMDSEKIEIILPGLDSNYFTAQNRNDQSSYRKRLGIPNDYFIVSFITSGDFEKRGFSTFIEILSLLKSIIPNLWVLVVGNEKRRSNVHKVLHKTVSNEYTYIPITDDMDKIYAVTDVMVHPAVYEEFGMVVAEALSSGTPVITSQRVGASSIIKDYAPEILLNDSDDIQNWCDGIGRIYSEYSIYSQLFLDIAEKVKMLLDWNVHLSRLEEIIKAICDMK